MTRCGYGNTYVKGFKQWCYVFKVTFVGNNADGFFVF
jgi:hypothetical protein